MKNKRIEKLEQIVRDRDALLLKQNNMIIRLNEEVDHATRLIEFYEACISKGVKIEIHELGKGGNAVNTGDVKFGQF